MEYKSEAKYLRISPRKLREVVDVVKKQSLPYLLVNLQHINKKGSNFLLKALKSAIANIENNFSLTLDKLKLKTIAVNEGPSFKRWRPVSRGRAHPYKKRTSHIKIILTDKSETRSTKSEIRNKSK